MTPKTTLAEARRLCLETYVTAELGDRVDYRTGEILQTRTYASVRYHLDTSALSPSFTDCASREALSRFMAHIDHRTLITVSDCRRLYDLDKGSHHLHGRTLAFTNQQYARMTRLVARLDYANVILTTPNKIARSLGIHRNHLYRYLNGLGPLVRLQGARDGVARGNLKILISPAYGYRYPKAELAQARSDSLASWYRPTVLQ